MKDLIERLESAAIGGRDLDAEIALAIGYVTERDGNLFFGNKDHTTLVLECDYYDHGGAAPELPHYTTSLDAAMTLVPDGYGAVSASLNERGASSMRIGHPYVFGNGATPALALCIAALKARMA